MSCHAQRCGPPHLIHLLWMLLRPPLAMDQAMAQMDTHYFTSMTVTGSERALNALRVSSVLLVCVHACVFASV
jgi:hypothetical protein